ncbi:MAG TPA: glycoside hydrolase family 15 protein [Phycisphaerales bacterium]|nr:glycoside hydrolase family 15 protein [Phycisphaerales bacterium]
MPRDLPIGNGDLLVTFDEQYRARDIYFPYVGKYNQTEGYPQRFGVWCDGAFAWIDDAGWTRSLRYRADTLVTEVVLEHAGMGLRLLCNDCVDFHESVWLRKVTIEDTSGGGSARDARVFFHIDPSIQETQVGDTANYDPATAGLIIYKGDFYFLVNGCHGTSRGIDHWAIGSKRIGSAEGTWRDAEDGVLGRNAISQGSVDATVGVNVSVPAGGSAFAHVWIVFGRDYDSAARANRMIWERTPDKFIARTDAYWKLWAVKDASELDPLPRPVRDLYIRSLLVLRTQIDNRGAIIAANDSDITHFAGDTYSYCWPRDGALVAYALILANQSELSREFFRYCGRCVNKHGYFLHKYTPEGRLASSWHPWVIDGKPALPVQQDETALVLWSLRQHFLRYHDVEFVKPLYSSLVIAPAKWMVDHRDANGLPQPSWDLWEERRGVHTFTVAATIAALRAARDFALDFGDAGRAAWFEKGAAEMAAAMMRHLWNPAEGRFARMATPDGNGGYTLDMTADSANFAVWWLGALECDNAHAEGEMAALRELLWCKTSIGGCARYQNDYYHRVVNDNPDIPGNPWVICTLWHAQWATARATTVEELQPALDLLSWAAQRAADSGVLAEQVHPLTGAMLSVSPLTWSHATVVIAVQELLAKRRRLLGRGG